MSIKNLPFFLYPVVNGEEEHVHLILTENEPPPASPPGRGGRVEVGK